MKVWSPAPSPLSRSRRLAGGQPLRLKAEMLLPDVEFDWDPVLSVIAREQAGNETDPLVVDGQAILNGALSVTMAGIRAYSAATGTEPAEAAAMMATYCAGETAGA